MDYDRMRYLYQQALNNGYTERAKSLLRLMGREYPEMFVADYPEQNAEMRQGGVRLTSNYVAAPSESGVKGSVNRNLETNRAQKLEKIVQLAEQAGLLNNTTDSLDELTDKAWRGRYIRGMGYANELAVPEQISEEPAVYSPPPVDEFSPYEDEIQRGANHGRYVRGMGYVNMIR